MDVIISNCVINLSSQKERVFEEAFRALKQGGRLAISDIVAMAQLPDEVRADPAQYAGCMAGAAQLDELQSMLEEAGFTRISIKPRTRARSSSASGARAATSTTLWFRRASKQ